MWSQYIVGDLCCSSAGHRRSCWLQRFALPLVLRNKGPLGGVELASAAWPIHQVWEHGLLPARSSGLGQRFPEPTFVDSQLCRSTQRLVHQEVSEWYESLNATQFNTHGTLPRLREIHQRPHRGKRPLRVRSEVLPGFEHWSLP